MRDYGRMLPRLQAEESFRALTLALVTNGRALNDGERNEFYRELDEQRGPRERPARAPKVTPAFLQSAGIRMSNA